MKLPRNSFAVAGSIRQCWLFVYRVPEEIARPLLPAPLRLVTHGGYAFLNIVVCRLSGMRPAFLPAGVGLGYWHVAYRWHACAATTAGTAIEGLHFIRSDCDRWIVAQSGNLLTDFHFHRAAIRIETTPASVTGRIRVSEGDANFRIDRQAPPALAPGSPFATLEEAAAFLKYKPFGLAVESADTLQIVRVRREESAWRSRCVKVLNAEWQLLAGWQAVLEICYEVEPIGYRWERGITVRVVP